MKYPGLFAGAMLAAGVYLGHEWPGLTGSFTSIALALSVVCRQLGGRLLRRSTMSFAPGFFCLASVLALVGTGVLNYRASRLLGPSDLANWTTAGLSLDASVRGRLRSCSDSATGTTSCSLDVESVVYGGRRYPARGRALARFRRDEGSSSNVTPALLHPGDEVVISGTLFAPSPARNPNDFDAAAYYRRLGIATLLDAHPSGLQFLAHRHSGLSYRMESLRTRFLNRILGLYESEAARELLPALFLGERGLISRDTGNAFRSSGLSHLLAISGLHVGIVGMTLFWLVGVLVSRTGLSFQKAMWIRCSIVLAVLLAYTALSGGSPSVCRATTMAGVLLAGKVFERRVPGWNTLGIAATIMLALRPDDLFSAGFQLSFSAVAGIFVLSDSTWLGVARRRIRGILPGWMVDSIFVSLAVTSSTLPVILYHFGTAALAGLAANLIAIPLTALLLISGLFSTAAGTLSGIGTILVSGTDALASLLFLLARVSAAALGGLRLDASPHALYPAAWLPLLVLWHCGRRGGAGAAWKLQAAAAGLLLLTPRVHPALRIAVLDVGQGDGIVMLSPSRKAVVIDTGWGRAQAESIRRYLVGEGIRHIDLLVVSHFHRDHAGGLPWLIDSIPVSRVVFAEGKRTEWVRLSGDAARPAGARPAYSEMARGDTLRVDDVLRIYVLGPRRSHGATSPENASSVVLKVLYGSTSILLTGDAERASENALVADFGAFLRSGAVKVAHHGSKTSSSEPFLLRSASPGGFAVISVGETNRFHHPDLLVVRRWQRRGETVLSTAREAAIVLETDGNRWSRIEWRDQ